MFAIYAGSRNGKIGADYSGVDFVLATFDTVTAAQLYLGSLGAAGRAYKIAECVAPPHNPEPKKAVK